MSVQNPHHFSPLWLLSNNKPINTTRNRSGFATLNGGNNVTGGVTLQKNYTPQGTDTFLTSNNTFRAEFPSLHTNSKSKVAIDNGVWSLPRGKGKFYHSIKQTPKPLIPSHSLPVPGNTSPPSNSPANYKQKTNEQEKPSSPKGKSNRPHDTSKFDFFNSLREDEGLATVEGGATRYEPHMGAGKRCSNNDKLGDVLSDQTVPLSSSVETEHRLLKVMGWTGDTAEPPLTDEEVLLAKQEIEEKKKDRTLPTLSPFPWAPKFYLPEDEDDVSDDSDDDF